MTAKLNRSIIIALIIALIYSNNIFCLPEIKDAAEPTTTNIIDPSNIHEQHFTLDILDRERSRFFNFKKDDDYDDDDNHKKSEREKKKEMRKNRFENKSGRKYSKHEDSVNGDSDSDDDDDDDDNKSKHKSTPSNTVVTTIIIVATETPTSIYSGTVNPAKQKGTGNAGHQVSDPNSSSKGNDNDEPSETALTDQLYKDQSSYHKLVLALSIVGGIAGVALITGLLLFTRVKIRKRKRKLADLEAAEASNSNMPPSPPTHYSPPIPPPKARYSTMSDDGDSTVIEFNQNPFLDPSTTVAGNKDTENSNTVTVLPNAPPSLPVHLEPRQYSDYRQNRTLSMISQTAGATLPSAPTAKELDGMSRYENPFEDTYGSSRRYAVLDENENELHDSPISSPIMRPLSSPLENSQTSSFFSDLPPPPAYTPSAAPSAPPLYALPTSREFTTQQQAENDSSRRHSISSCSMISTNRPLSLRRGSGSPAHISSPFS